MTRVRLRRSVDVGKDVTLNQNIRVLADIECVTAIAVPVVIVGVPVVAKFNLGRAARGMMDVIVGKGYLIVLAITKTVTIVSP